MQAQSLIPGALERAESVIAIAQRQGGGSSMGVKWNSALELAKARKISLGVIDAAAKLFGVIGQSNSPGDLSTSANQVHEALKETFDEANEWRARRKDGVFAFRRVRLSGGVLLLVLAGVVHAWHLMGLTPG